MNLCVFAFTMPAFGYQGTILPSRNGSDSHVANLLTARAEAGVRVWNDASGLGYGESGQSNAKGASLG